MTIQIKPEQAGVWRLRATLTKKAIESGDGRFFIPSFDTGKIYSSQFIAVGVKVNSSKDNWRHGGYLSQEFKFASNGYAHNNKAFNRSQDLLINEVTILNLPNLSNNYRLRYFPPTYFSDVRLQIWEYVGQKTDLLLRDLADFLRNAPPSVLINLPEINSKLDLLLNRQTVCPNVDLSALEAKIDLLLIDSGRPQQLQKKKASQRRHQFYFGNLI